MERQAPTLGRRLPVPARPVKIAVTVADSKDLLPKVKPKVSPFLYLLRVSLYVSGFLSPSLFLFVQFSPSLPVTSSGVSL